MSKPPRYNVPIELPSPLACSPGLGNGACLPNHRTQICCSFFLFAMNEVSLHLPPIKKRKSKCLEFCAGGRVGGVCRWGLNFVPQCLFFWSIMWCSQNGNDLSKDLANQHWPQAKNESEVFLRHPSTIFGYPTWSMYRKSWRFLFKFGRIMAIEYLKMYLIFTTFIFSA